MGNFTCIWTIYIMQKCGVFRDRHGNSPWLWPMLEKATRYFACICPAKKVWGRCLGKRRFVGTYICSPYILTSEISFVLNFISTFVVGKTVLLFKSVQPTLHHDVGDSRFARTLSLIITIPSRKPTCRSGGRMQTRDWHGSLHFEKRARLFKQL